MSLSGDLGSSFEIISDKSDFIDLDDAVVPNLVLISDEKKYFISYTPLGV